MKIPDISQRVIELLAYLLERKTFSAPFCYDIVISDTAPLLVEPEILTNQPLHPVALHRGAELAAGGYSKPRPVGATRRPDNDKVGRVVLLS